MRTVTCLSIPAPTSLILLTYPRFPTTTMGALSPPFPARVWFFLFPHSDTGNSGPRYTEVLVEVEKNGATVCRVYRVYLITYTTDFAHKGFCTMAASAVASGFRLNVLGVCVCVCVCVCV